MDVTALHVSLTNVVLILLNFTLFNPRKLKLKMCIVLLVCYMKCYAVNRYVAAHFKKFPQTVPPNSVSPVRIFGLVLLLLYCYFLSKPCHAMQNLLHQVFFDLFTCSFSESILLSILSDEACNKSGLPTFADLLANP